MPVLRNSLAFLYAVLIYVAVVLIVFFKLYTYKDRAVKYTDMKNTFIDLELGSSVPIPAMEEDKKNIKELFNQEAVKKHVTSKMKAIEKDEERESKLNELFGKLDFKDDKSAKIQAAFKSSKKTSNEAAKITKKLDNLKENVSILGQNKNESKAGVYDPFLGALRRILEQRWRLYRTSGDFSAKVHFTISENGYFYYDEVINSGDEDFDEKLYNFLDNIKGKYITLPPNNKPYSGILELSDKIK